MRKILIIISLIFFSCSSTKKIKSNTNSKIDIGYIREISKYSNFKHFISRNFECKTIESTFNYGENNKTGNESITKCYYPKEKELVYINFTKESDLYLKQEFFYRKNLLVSIKSFTSINKKDTVFSKIFVKNDSIYYNMYKAKDSTYLLKKGLDYINNFES